MTFFIDASKTYGECVYHNLTKVTHATKKQINNEACLVFKHSRRKKGAVK